MKKKVFAFLLSSALLVGVSTMFLPVNAQTRPTIDIDENPSQSGRLFVDQDYGPIHVTGCIDEPGDCLATIVIQG